MEVGNNNKRDYLVWGDEKVSQRDESELAIELLKAEEGDKQYPIRAREMKEWDMSLIYSCKEKDCSVWTPEMIKDI
jgi:hypothetical protein